MQLIFGPFDKKTHDPHLDFISGLKVINLGWITLALVYFMARYSPLSDYEEYDKTFRSSMIVQHALMFAPDTLFFIGGFLQV